MEHMAQFNVVDVVALILMTIGMIRGVSKGLSGELAELISAAAALVVGWRFYQPLGNYLKNVSRMSETGSYLAAFLVILVGGYIAMRLLRVMLRALMEFSFKGKLERIGGGLAGLLRTTVVISAFILIVALIPQARVHRVVAEESVFGKFLYNNLGPVYDTLSEKYPALKIPREQQVDFSDGEPKAEPSPKIKDLGPLP
jgi:uncharacterized membrane protein required for colicin V production